MKKIFLLFYLFPILCLSAQQKQPFKIIAYYTGNGEAIKQWPVDKLSHIIFSFLKIQNDTLTFHNQNQEKSLQQLVALKKEYPRLKIMVSVGGWGGCSFCSGLFASNVHRQHFAKTTVALFKQYGIDAIDLDWEYPAIEGYPGHAYAAADKNNFTELFKGIKLSDVSVSMTINSTAVVLLAFYLVLAEKQHADKKQLRGTLQNDILKEHIARGTNFLDV